MAVSRSAFIWAIGEQESNGNYAAVNSGSGALGKYQVMPANVASWTQQALGHSLTPSQFLASPSAQEAVADHILGGYYDKYGPAGAASAWYSGSPSNANNHASQNGGPSIADYVQQTLSKAAGAPGGTGGTGGASSSAYNMSPQQEALSGSAYYSPDSALGSSPMSVEDALSQYGFVGTLANTVPELKNLLVQGAQQGWTTTKFQQEVQDTQWWKTHAEKARENDALKATDPAEYQNQRDQIGSHLNLILDQMGVTLGSKDYQQLVNLAFNQGWQDEQLQEFIGMHGKLQHNKGGHLVGQAGNLGVQLKEAYSNYGIKYSGDTINANVRAILAGHSTIDGITSQIRNSAKSAFPGLADAIDGGMTVRQIADPYIQSMGSILEVDPNKLTLNTPEIRKALSGQGDAIDNKVQSSTPLWKFENELRHDPRWDKTDNARNAAFQVVHQIGTDWGFSS